MKPTGLAAIMDNSLDASEEVPSASRCGMIEEYDGRRCLLCNSHIAVFGFGPPLTKTAKPVWACHAHREAVDRSLTEKTAHASNDSQLQLL